MSELESYGGDREEREDCDGGGATLMVNGCHLFTIGSGCGLQDGDPGVDLIQSGCA